MKYMIMLSFLFALNLTAQTTNPAVRRLVKHVKTLPSVNTLCDESGKNIGLNLEFEFEQENVHFIISNPVKMFVSHKLDVFVTEYFRDHYSLLSKDANDNSFLQINMDEDGRLLSIRQTRNTPAAPVVIEDEEEFFLCSTF